MDATIRDKWAAKLESGEYDQATGALRRGDAFCCLGVLCEVFREETGEGEWTLRVGDSDDEEFAFTARGTRNGDHLPIAVRDWAGLSETNPELDPDDPDGWAAYLNDHKLNFQEIAELVRQLPADEVNADTDPDADLDYTVADRLKYD